MKYFVIASLLLAAVAVSAAPKSKFSEEMASRSASLKQRWQLEKKTKLTVQYGVVTTPVCGMCQFAVADIEAGIQAVEEAYLEGDIKEYFDSLCKQLPTGLDGDADDKILQNLCLKVVQQGVCTAVDWTRNQYMPSPSAVCQAVGLCGAPVCPVGFSPSLESPSLCVWNQFPAPDTYPGVKANCSQTATAAHLCSLTELWSMNAADIAQIITALSAQIAAWNLPYFNPTNPQLIVQWTSSYADYDVVGKSQIVGTDPRVLVGSGWKDGDNWLFQWGFNIKTGNLVVAPWFGLDPNSIQQHTLPYTVTPAESASIIVGTGLCCAPRQQ